MSAYKSFVEYSSSSAGSVIFTTLSLEAIAAVVCVVLSFTEAVVSCVLPAVVCISVLSTEADIVVLLLFLLSVFPLSSVFPTLHALNTTTAAITITITDTAPIIGFLYLFHNLILRLSCIFFPSLLSAAISDSIS